MSRPKRVFERNVSVHVIHRGHNGKFLFGDDTDYELFLALLKGSSEAEAVAVHTFALMTNHYHLIVTPDSETALPNAMRRANGDYAKYFNRKYQRFGTLFAGRYRAPMLKDENYCLTCMRYVDLNPVRARMVVDAAQYRWSSYRAHACGDGLAWLSPHPVYLALGATAAERQAKYRLLCATPLTDADLALQRFHPTKVR
jgi:putative transposase